METMKARIHVDTTTAAQLLGHLTEGFTPYRRARTMKAVGEQMADDLQDRLLTGRFRPPRALKPTTREIRSRLGHSRPLVRSGKLARSIKVLHAGPRKVTIGSRMSYAGELNEEFEFLEPDADITVKAVLIVIDHHLGDL